MTIRQNGGIFGRNPTFNNVTVDGILTVDQIVEQTSAAGITLDGVTLKDGNVVLADGKGIDFSATSGTGTSELFDDYEEGTWTPEITASTVGDLAVTYSSQTGLYTKIGRTVTVYASLATSSFTHSTASGTARVTNLPFTVGQRGLGILAFDNITKTAYTSFFAGASAGTTYADLSASRSGGTTSTVKITEMPSAGAVFLQFTLTYTV